MKSVPRDLDGGRGREMPQLAKENTGLLSMSLFIDLLEEFLQPISKCYPRLARALAFLETKAPIVASPPLLSCDRGLCAPLRRCSKNAVYSNRVCILFFFTSCMRNPRLSQLRLKVRNQVLVATV